jgi:hypothetical protein
MGAGERGFIGVWRQSSKASIHRRVGRRLKFEERVFRGIHGAWGRLDEVWAPRKPFQFETPRMDNFEIPPPLFVVSMRSKGLKESGAGVRSDVAGEFGKHGGGGSERGSELTMVELPPSPTRSVEVIEKKERETYGKVKSMKGKGLGVRISEECDSKADGEEVRGEASIPRPIIGQSLLKVNRYYAL